MSDNETPTETLTITCEKCGAALEYRADEAVAFCGFCQTTNKLREISNVQEHFMLRIGVPREQLRSSLVGDLLKVPGVPSSVVSRLRIQEAKLVYVPFYVIQVHGNMKWSGQGRQATYSRPYSGAYRSIHFHTEPEQGQFDDQTTVVIPAGKPDERMQNYRISARGRRFFALGEITEQGAEHEEPSMSFDDAQNKAIGVLVEKHNALLSEELQSVEGTDYKYDVLQNHLVHVPMWYVSWKLAGSGKVQHSILDAAADITIWSDVARSKLYYIAYLSFGLAFLGLAALLLYAKPFDSLVLLLPTVIMAAVLGGQTLVKGRPKAFEETTN